jgi:hypothetical protein
MRIGVPKEIKTQEFRVGMTPSGVAILVSRGHTVLVEQGAGIGSSIPDDAFVKAGARIVATRDEDVAEATILLHVEVIRGELGEPRHERPVCDARREHLALEPVAGIEKSRRFGALARSTAAGGRETRERLPG